MMISAWWIIPLFVLGAYAGITLMAVMNAASRRAPQPNELQFPDDSRLRTIAAALHQDDAIARKNRERRKRKRNESKRRAPDPMENQAHFQW